MKASFNKNQMKANTEELKVKDHEDGLSDG